MLIYLEDEYKEVVLDDGKRVRVWGVGYHGTDAGSNLVSLVNDNKEAIEDKSITIILLIHEFQIKSEEKERDEGSASPS